MTSYRSASGSWTYGHEDRFQTRSEHNAGGGGGGKNRNLFLDASMSLIFLPLISFPDSLSSAFFRSL